MCLLFFSYRTSPGYHLVLAANRDEFLDRPTAPLAFLDREKTILGGRDLRGGGTWLGISSNLKFAAITNYREPGLNKPAAPSRGKILLDYLQGELAPADYLQELAESAPLYNGYNLVLGDRVSCYYYSNRSGGARLLAPGFYGLSNHLLDTGWPKVVRGKELLYPEMVGRDKGERLDLQKVFELLADTEQPPDHLLPDTGVGLQWERLLGTIFIDGETYGTRSSAVITVSDEGEVVFQEKTIQRSSSGEKSCQLTRYAING